ncbi:universal stress protein [Corallococcus praedator]|uniref:Universal stress protein n=1 Tax=Corallococcus praedator TaxID=2316724 RepID=A0ABX9QQ24_9BACT|nr:MULTISPECIES: universal stress protein [Corallococcus]RKH18819.1 universal stress protein [Corallococcus sp. CA047B]RKH33954.1 universal stress protein [Corallococcus sp. CA031C]RKI14297.1 universal stress protein [Corallococcus praedator]
MTILCAIDFSEGARQAATVAALLAARHEQPLLLVHQVHPDELIGAAEPVREGLQALLREEAARLEALGARVQVALVESASPQALSDLRARHDARLLVVGPPRGELPYPGAGGSLDRIAQATSIPLLRVRDAAPFQAWLAGQRPLRVMLGVDRSRGTLAARGWLTELGRYGPLELMAGNVYYVYEQCQRLGLPVPATMDDASPLLRDMLSREVATLADAGAGQPVRVHLRQGVGRAADHLVDLAQEQEADVLVLGTHHHTALGNLASVAHHALRLAPMAVVAVPVRDAASQGEAPLPQVRRLLVATDLSPLADEAIPLAFALAPQGAEVHLVTVVQEPLTPEEQRDLERQLLERVPRGLEQRHVRVQAEVFVAGEVAAMLTQAAERLDADLLCMGSRGHGGLKEALLGSVTRQVLAQSRRPVLVLRPPAR